MTEFFSQLITQYGYWTVAALVCIESFGIPVPGETALIMASAYAATTAKMNIWLVVLSATGGAVLGDNIGFWLGQQFGYWLLIRYGHYVGLSELRIKVGQYLFLRHGQRVVFVSRFLPLMREISAFLAGANQMKWKPFLTANAAGALFWAFLYGFGAYGLGKGADAATQGVEIWIGVLTGAALVALMVYFHRHEKRLEGEAERAFGVIDLLDAERIARQQQAARPGLVDRARVHAAQLGGARLAVADADLWDVALDPVEGADHPVDGVDEDVDRALHDARDPVPHDLDAAL